jgi:hypothetical protein
MMPIIGRIPQRRGSPHALRTLCGVVVLAAALGCADLFGPPERTGTYVLERLAGRPLPTLIWLTQTHRWTLLADTLTLQPDESGLIRGILRRESLSDRSDQVVVINNQPVVLEERAGGQLWLRVTTGCADVGACAPTEFRLDFGGTELLVERFEGTARYRRIE